MSSENITLVKLNNAGFKQNDKWLVEGVSLTVEKGKIVTLIGPNGSGKSTTAKIALGIYKNIEGSVEKYTNKVGYVPQKISIDWTLPLRLYDFMLLTENIKDEAIDEALTLTGVIHLKNKNLGNLSGGEFQRILIARAISKKPELLVLDEPVQGVDYTGEIALYELIKRISDTLNCGILLISHDLHTVMTATDHVVCLNGHVCCSGSPMDVAKNNEYKTLFGEQASQILSVYEHKHDHVHSDKGEIKNGKMDGLGFLIYPYGGKSVVGEWMNGKEWNTKHTKKDGTLLGNYLNGEWIIRWGLLYRINGKWSENGD